LVQHNTHANLMPVVASTYVLTQGDHAWRQYVVAASATSYAPSPHTRAPRYPPRTRALTCRSWCM
jgi:hypothetical protein